MFRARGTDYFNPDEVARELSAERPTLTQTEANARAWGIGRTLLERAIHERLDFAFETTLGGTTMTRLLELAAERGIEVRVWYVGLASPTMHVQRVASRVRRGGHPIPEEDIRRRWDRSRLNLIRLLPRLRELRVYDNSEDADPARGRAPQLGLLLHVDSGEIVGPEDLSRTPEWARPIVAAAIEQSLG